MSSQHTTHEPALQTTSDSESLGTREAILVVAREMFVEKGYVATSTSAIGKRIGISAAALYWHFPSKEAILFTLIEERLVGFIDEVTSDHTDPAKRLAELVNKHVTIQLSPEHDVFGYGYLTNMALSGRALTPQHEQQITDMHRKVYRMYRDTIVAGIEQSLFHIDEAIPATFAIINTCEGVQEWARAHDRLSIAQLAQAHVELALRIVGFTADESERVTFGTPPQ